MSVGPMEERIARNLHVAVERLAESIAAVELWSGALRSFAKPVPGYESVESRYVLPPAGRAKSRTKAARTPHSTG